MGSRLLSATQLIHHTVEVDSSQTRNRCGWGADVPLTSQVVRCFEDDDVIHVNGRVDPVEDISVINFELALADLGQVGQFTA